MKVQAKYGKVTQIMNGASRNYRYVWDVSVAVFYCSSPVYGEQGPGASPLDHRRPRRESASSATIGAGPRCRTRTTAVGSQVPYGLGACIPSSTRSSTTAGEAE